MRNRLQTDIVRNELKCLRLMSHPRFESMMMLTEKLVLIHRRVARVKMDKNFVAGFSVLDLARENMVADYYWKIKPAYFSASVLASDT